MKADELEIFRKKADENLEEVCRILYKKNRADYNIKNEELAVRNYILLTKSTLKLCIKKGFQAMTTRDLCRESGLSMGALYYYFSSKEDIVRFIHEQGHLFTQRTISEYISNIKDPREKLHKAIEVHIMLSEISPEWFFFFFMETKNLTKEMRTIPMLSDIWFENTFISILQEGKKAGIYTFDNVNLIGAAIKSLLHDWYLRRWRYKQEKISMKKYINFVISIIESYIKK